MNNLILVLSLAEINRTSSRVLKESYSLLNAGFSVHVVSICYGEQLEDEQIEGVSVRRFKLSTKSLPSSFAFQILKWIEWYCLLCRWLRKGWQPAIIDCHCLYSLLIGVLLSRKLKCKVVFNAHELETERAGLAGFRKKFSKWLEARLVKYCGAVIVVSQSILEWYKEAYPNIEIECIYNAPLLQQPIQNNYFRNAYNLSDTDVVFLYQGGFAVGRGIPLLLETFAMLPSNYHVVFMGYGALESEIMTYSVKYSNIHIHNVVSQKDLCKYTASAYFGFSLIEAISLSYELCMPNKLFEYTMYEVPVIVSATKDQVSFVKTNEIGYVLEDYSPNGLKELILSLDITARDSLVQNMKKIKNDICWEKQEKKLLEIYKKLII